MLITTVAILLDGPALVHRGRRLVPAERLERADEIGRIVYHSIARYFAGSLSVALLNGTVILGASLILGVPLALLAGCGLPSRTSSHRWVASSVGRSSWCSRSVRPLSPA